jgi:hypothetical protein
MVNEERPMKPLVLLPLSLLLFSAPAVAADLDRPLYGEREYIESPLPPRVVERERIIEHHHHHYAPAPVYRERRYVEPEVYYRPRREYAYYDSYRYTHAGWWKPRHFFPRHHHHWRHHHRHGW